MRARSVLVVEDSDEDFGTVQDAALLIGLVHPLVRARSGNECLRQLRQWRDGPRSQEMLPVLLLLDLNTPGDDGRTVLCEVRSDDVLGTLPVVVLSASANPRDLRFCYANGANAYHVKPVAYLPHLNMLKTLLGYWLGSVMLPA